MNMEKSYRFYYLIATVLGLGNFPVAPGTAGSLAGLVACVLLHGNLTAYVIAFLVLFVAGVKAAGKVEDRTGIKDPSIVIIDEFACIFLVYLLVPLKPLTIIIGFILYRVIDIIKLPPMRSFESLEGGWGIMLDDFVGGIYTNLILQILIALKIII